MLKSLCLSLFLVAPATGLYAQSADSSSHTADSTQPGGLSRTLDETVVTGVPIPVRIQNALSQYRVITREAMKAQGAVTLADALGTQLNINIGNDRVLGSNITLQGLG